MRCVHLLSDGFTYSNSLHATGFAHPSERSPRALSIQVRMWKRGKRVKLAHSPGPSL